MWLARSPPLAETGLYPPSHLVGGTGGEQLSWPKPTLVGQGGRLLPSSGDDVSADTCGFQALAGRTLPGARGPY